MVIPSKEKVSGPGQFQDMVCGRVVQYISKVDHILLEVWQIIAFYIMKEGIQIVLFDESQYDVICSKSKIKQKKLQFYTEQSMSITVSTSEQICHSPTNNSRSKMLFSFSKSSRFAHNKENQGHKFYDLTGCMRKRSTCFGYGKKYDFTKEMPNTPAPGTYEKQTLFDVSKKKNKGFCFGSGRQQMEVTGLTPKNENPGPGTYESSSQRGKISYSLRAKLKIDNREKTYVPGPGKYEAYSTFNLNTKNFLSKHINKQASRFQTAEKLKKEDLKVPGPGAYDTSKTDLSPEGRYCLSKLRTVKSRRFGTSLRNTFQNRCQTPGPGNYKIPSEFGHYLSKKYASESTN